MIAAYRAQCRRLLISVTKTSKTSNMGFYCQKVCGDVNFSIEEWNKAFKYCNDAIDEGIERERDGMCYHDIYRNYVGRNYDKFLDPISSYLTLWQSINGLDSLKSNPWVWVISFKKL